MEKTLTEMCDYLNNYWWRKKIAGKFVITNGSISIDGIQNNQYFRVIGSVFNDGVHKYPTSTMVDEEFDGYVWLMAVPPTAVSLASDIDSWKELYGSADSAAMSPFDSESFGNYSYSKSSGGSDSASGSANPNSWQSAFSDRLDHFRKLRGCR